MVTAALVFAALAAALHVYIFVLESFRWTAPRTRATFGTTAEEAETTKLMAYNQGFYNLFLAVVTAVGVGLMISGGTAAGAALVFAGAGSMSAAAVVLVLSARDKFRSAAIQGTLPFVAVVLLGIGSTLGAAA
ncbi:DUF1304 domain-containing protein [Mycolicibacterium sediminis]|uniref:DUF1304 domain-containing protein n=1 Tax=Mycolicibacterium sediminis TaxID=1286180 RepID=UPI0013CFA941|nr:DUF1304 domain-containing protein [Mycolicibacterium sediminis]